MRVTAAVALVAVAALAGAACGSQPVGPSPSTEVLSLKLETAHFRIWADRAGLSTLRDIADRLEAELPRVSADLGATTMPVTTVEVWTDRESYYADMVASVGRRYEGSTGYIVGPTNVTILVTSDPARTASHELVHCVTMGVNPTIANNPRWLWETVATYENGEWVDPRTLAYLQAGSFPTLAQLDGDFAVTRQIYEVGFLIGEFIVAVWGKDGLVQLVLANGDIPRVFGNSVVDFEQRWAAFVLRKYFGMSLADPTQGALGSGGADAWATTKVRPSALLGPSDWAQGSRALRRWRSGIASSRSSPRGSSPRSDRKPERGPKPIRP